MYSGFAAAATSRIFFLVTTVFLVLGWVNFSRCSAQIEPRTELEEEVSLAVIQAKEQFLKDIEALSLSADEGGSRPDLAIRCH